MENLVEQVKTLYEQLDQSLCTEANLGEVYDDDIHFRDPFHDIRGLDALARYLHGMYQGVELCRFAFQEPLVAGNQATLEWTMSLVHPRLKRGKLIEVEGVSLFRGEQRIVHHRDYFDGGQLLYENLPLMGGLIGMLKSHLAKEA